uniref:TIAM Rac1 associated GEF 2a n=1 Tax=Oreochromis niloticus TaxID=8128 RepID=A0A669F540_ORENI
MGNADSHSSFVSPAKPSCSFRFSSRREEVTSARSWWRSSQGGCRSRGKSYLNHPTAGSPYTSWRYEPAPKAARGGAKLRAGSPQRLCRGERGQFEGVERASLKSSGSPKVLLSNDGSMRVEFTKAQVEPQGLSSLPTITATATTAAGAEASLRTSNGSSLSSDGSWYDSPWGNGELTDNVFVARTSHLDLAPPSSSPPQRLMCLLLQPQVTTPAPLAGRRTAGLATQSFCSRTSRISKEEGSAGDMEEHYSSCTLPCRNVESASTASVGNNRKDLLKSRIRRLSDWTGSLSRKKRRIQEPFATDTANVFISGLNAGAVSCSALWSSDPLHSVNHNQFPTLHCGSSRSLNQNSDAQRQNIYENFMQELEMGCSSTADRTEPSEGDGDEGEEDEEEMDGDVEVGGGEQLDVLFEKEQGVVRRAGWLSFKALITLNKDRKLELVARRKWRHYWVTLKGCTLLFYETYGRSSGSADQELSPRYALLADDSIVQAVPEHPRKEHVFCLSNSYGDVYLFQATSQTDLENWVTAIHSASASLLVKRQGKEDTLRLLRSQSRSLLHKIDMDGKMKKMAELQLSIIKEPKSRKAVESQIQQWEQNLEKLNLDLFRLRCYLSSLQGSELPNPKSLLAVASRPSKSMLGRLGVFSVSSFHALVSRGSTAGDEVLAVNGAPVSGLDLDLLQSLFRHQKLQLLLRRDESPEAEEPADLWPDHADPFHPCCQPPATNIHTWITGTAETEVGLQPVSPTHLSVCQRLRKVIQELVDTEKSYVKDLVCLFDIYLTPLQKETFLSKDEMEALFGSLPEMLDFQRVFLQTLEERIATCPNFSSLETPEQFKKLLFPLGGSFLYYADHFKLYSGFCANHIKVQKVLERAKTDAAFKQFLEARNPTNQHSSSLESYLIKPVQRVLKYPLLLRELVSLTDAESPEHTHLTEALRAMEKVASHINEMQKIYEDYGCVFDQLAAEQSGADKQVTEISMGEFLVHSSVVWLNPLPSLGRLRKEPELTLFVFKRAVILVYRENSKLKKKMTSSRSADLDPFRFRWLIPVSAVQVRPANITGSEDPCVWELVHSRSEVEGRPETVFQLCSSGLETKASVLRALRSLLRDRAPVGSLRRSRLSTAERSASWRRRQQRCSDAQKTIPHQLDESCRSDGVLGDTCSEPLLPSHASSSSAAAGMRGRLCSLTSELEAQLQRLNFREEEVEQGGTSISEEEKNKRSSSLRRSPGDLQDLSNLLERDFSVQSMTSMINEDCFYDPLLGLPTTAAMPAVQGQS